MSGKLNIERNDGSWLEGTFFWPSEFGCSENDQHVIMDLFIVWKNLRFNDITNETLWSNVLANLDSINENWLKIDSNVWLQDRVKFYTNYMLCAVVNQIWSSGFDINVIRKYYGTLTKAARDLEATTKVGYKKLIFSRIATIPMSINVDGILRKKSTRYYAITAIIVDRRKAKLCDLKEFMDLKEQIVNQETMIPVFSRAHPLFFHFPSTSKFKVPQT